MSYLKSQEIPYLLNHTVDHSLYSQDLYTGPYPN